MGKGDKKSKRGKIILGSFGVRRRRKAKKGSVTSLPSETAKIAENPAPEAAVETKAAKPARTARPKTTAKPAARPAAKKSEKEAGGDAEKAAKPAARTKKPAAEKEE